MKKRGIFINIALLFITILFITQFISAQSIEVNYPGEINNGEEFSFKIKLVDFKEGTYDLKIDLLSSSGKRIAKIFYDDSWKSTYYYVKEAIESNKEEDFKMKVEDYSGKAGFEIKVRSSSGTVKSFSDYEIEVLNEGSEEKEDRKNTDEEDSKEIEKDEEKGDKNDNSEETKIEDEAVNDAKIEKLSNEAVEITKIDNVNLKVNSDVPQNIKSNENVEVKDKAKSNAFYGLVLFSILVLLLFTLKFLMSKLSIRKNGIA